MADLRVVPVADIALDQQQRAMIDIIGFVMADARAGNLAGLSIVRLLNDGRTASNWAGRTNAAMTTLVGATFMLATEMATTTVPAPQSDGGTVLD